MAHVQAAAVLIALVAQASASRALPADELRSSCRDALAALDARMPAKPGADLCLGYFSAVQTLLRIGNADKFPAFAVCTPRDIAVAELIRLFAGEVDAAAADDRRLDAVVIALHAYKRAYPCP